jgi:hypothetical protein
LLFLLGVRCPNLFLSAVPKLLTDCSLRMKSGERGGDSTKVRLRGADA